MTPELIDRLTTHYVWAAQSDSAWHRHVTDAAKHNSPGQFDRVCWSALSRISRENGESLTGDMTRWIVNELRTQFFRERDVPSRFLPCLDKYQSEITAHMAKAKTILDGVEAEYQNAIFTTKETIMTTPAFQTKHFIFGQPTDMLTEEQLIEAIKKIEAEIANLKTVKTKSAKITAKIEELEAMLASVVGVLDAK